MANPSSPKPSGEECSLLALLILKRMMQIFFSLLPEKKKKKRRKKTEKVNSATPVHPALPLRVCGETQQQIHRT